MGPSLELHLVTCLAGVVAHQPPSSSPASLSLPTSMAVYTLLHQPKCSIRRFSLSLTFSFFSNISTSSSFSSLYRSHPFPPIPEPPPPVPKKVPFNVSVHGRTWQDPYHWMSNTNDPDLSDYLNRENSYAEAFMADTHKLQRTLFSEMTGRIPNNISTPPERFGPWFAHVPLEFSNFGKFSFFLLLLFMGSLCFG